MLDIELNAEEADRIQVSTDVFLAAPSLVRISPAGNLAPRALYSVLSYGGTLSGLLSNITLVAASRYAFVISTNTPGEVEVTASADPGSIRWVGGAPGIEAMWDDGITANWTTGTRSDLFRPADRLVFDDAGTEKVVALVGALNPGPSNAVLTVANDLALGGVTLVDIGNVRAVLSSNRVTGMGLLSLGGTAGGDDLEGGDAFDLSDAESTVGRFSELRLPALPAGLCWETSGLAAGGTLRLGVGQSGMVLIVR